MSYYEVINSGRLQEIKNPMTPFGYEWDNWDLARRLAGYEYYFGASPTAEVSEEGYEVYFHREDPPQVWPWPFLVELIFTNYAITVFCDDINSVLSVLGRFEPIFRDIWRVADLEDKAARYHEKRKQEGLEPPPYRPRLTPEERKLKKEKQEAVEKSEIEKSNNWREQHGLAPKAYA